MTTYQEWIASRPPAIRALAAEFPLGTRIMIAGLTHYVLGYGESDGKADALIVTPVDPAFDWVAANARRVRVCAEHFR
jgi:hypothetical protein